MAFGSEQWMYNAGGDFYPHKIGNSARLDNNAYFQRTPASNGSRTTWTWNAWVKLGSIGQTEVLFTARTAGQPANGTIGFEGGKLFWDEYGGASNTLRRHTAQVFRDPSAWYMITIVADTANATASDRGRVYINGTQVTEFSVNVDPSQNAPLEINTNISHRLGANPNNVQYFNGYLAEVNFVDGQALDPTSFGETKSGVWIPKRYSGSYGTNGFYLDFATRATDPIDASGNGNNWGSVNLLSTDWMLDSPTNNFATLNPLSIHGTTTTGLDVSEGGLKTTHSVTSQWQALHGTTPVSSGKWYYEVQVVTRPTAGTQNYNIGFYEANKYNAGYYGLAGNLTYGPESGVGQINVGTAKTPYGTLAPADGDIYMFALDLENDKFWVGLNGTWMSSGNPSTGANPSASGFAFENGVAKTWVPHHSDYAYGAPSGIFIHNYGQDSSFAGTKTAQGNTDANDIGDFYYAPPADHLALCSANLPAPAIDPVEDDIPADYFNTVSYTGTNSNQSISDVGFQPDFIWFKSRSTAVIHGLVDAVRGRAGVVRSDGTNAEELSNSGSDLVSFDPSGFTVGPVHNYNSMNQSGSSLVAWNWKAGGTAVANTDGTIASQVSANPKAGFSIVQVDSLPSSTLSTFGHGLGVKPDFIILKSRNNTTNWEVYHSSLTPDGERKLYLNEESAEIDSAFMGDTPPTSSVISFNPGSSTSNHIAYCFHSVEGFSKFGSYTGNGSADGPYVYTGFRPAYVMIKRSDGTGQWSIWDEERNTYNVSGTNLWADSTESEYTSVSGYGIDLTSNGFKLRNTHAARNASGGTYIFMAFAEQPFKYANAR